MSSCTHHPTCPPATSTRQSPLVARTVADHPEQGWRLLCNGVLLFDDGGYLLPTPAATSLVPVAA